ncbi:hypothetical protein [Rhodanobacter sp. DHG33]|uniref:hypothetical protein n=1 Tax=Rhodanobacter sp. DHG33 TaxID=2775921 RepID=UPI001784BCD7|nr:hypothetical protein [Rhodanobacter sp. DHG33]MBD8898364.1 hypothetical protein [Rhodanobacter sp. DHG33]
MRELPLLLNGAMVRAILDDRKAQTQRVMQPQLADDITPAAFPNEAVHGLTSSIVHCHAPGLFVAWMLAFLIAS